MEYEHLLLDKSDGIATITLNVPEKLNALTRTMGMNLPLAANEIAEDDDIRVVIVTGAGRAFCAGADVSAMADRKAETSRNRRLQFAGWPFADVFPRLNKPVIAAINGPCVGGGFSLALSCDIRIASETARFGVAQVARALSPDWGMTYYLPHAIGMSRALELMFTASMIDAAEAERQGIVSRVVPQGELINEARVLASRIAKQPPFSVELSKKLVWRSLFDGITRQLDLETYANQICSNSEDHRESVRAFLAKEPPPQFKGR